MFSFYHFDPQGLLLGQFSGNGIPRDATLVVPPFEALPSVIYDENGEPLTSENGSIQFNPPTNAARWDGTQWTLLAETPEAAALAANLAAAAVALKTSVVQLTQKRLDDFAQTRNYDGILSACTYATSAVPKFAAEGQYAVQARDATWAALYQFMADVQAGTQPVPIGFEDVEPLLPVMAWPQ